MPEPIDRRTFLRAGLGFTGALAVGACTRSTRDTARRGPPRDLAVFLSAEDLAEANQPSVEIAAFGSSYWKPGPERLYGYALRDLGEYLGKVTGDRYPLAVADGASGGGIYAGTFGQFPGFVPRQGASAEALSSSDPEAFIVEGQGDRLFILGKTPLGLLAATYTFLDALGCRWFAPGPEWESVPQTGHLSPEEWQLASAAPSYHARFFFSSYGANFSVFDEGRRDRLYLLWNLRNRMGGSQYTSNSHHAPIIPASLFSTRPELFAQSEGKRVPYELARGNPEAVAMATDIAVNYLRENEGKGSYFNSFSAEPNDGAPADEESLARIGNHTATDLDFWFANQIAAGLEKAGLTDKWVGILSYSDHASVPSFDLHPQVSVQVATDLDFTSNMTVEQRLDGFRQRKAKRLGIYEYLNLIIWSSDRPGVSPASKPREVAANLKRWHDHGARTYTAETSDSWVSGGVGQYLTSRLLWDVRADPQKELDAYYRGAFGPAADEIRALYEDWERRPAMTRGNLAQWHHLISTADRKVAKHPTYQARVNEIKRYYLYLNLLREFDINLQDPKVPSKAVRHNKLLTYLASNRGEDAFHAVGLFFTTLSHTGQPANLEVTVEELDEPFRTLMTDNYDKSAWGRFPPITDRQIDEMFDAVALPLDGQATGPGVLDPVVKTFPENAKAPAEISFPLLHGPGGGPPLQLVLNVVAPVKRLSLEILATNPQGGSTPHRKVVVTDPLDKEVKSAEVLVGESAVVELADLAPGAHTVTFPEQGANTVRVRGGSVFGGVRAFNDGWGFSPFRAATEPPLRAYFLVRARAPSLRVKLSSGTIALGILGGDMLAPSVTGSPQMKQNGLEVKVVPSSEHRVGFVEWNGASLASQGLVIDGVTLYSPDPSYVLYESLGP